MLATSSCSDDRGGHEAARPARHLKVRSAWCAGLFKPTTIQASNAYGRGSESLMMGGFSEPRSAP